MRAVKINDLLGLCQNFVLCLAQLLQKLRRVILRVEHQTRRAFVHRQLTELFVVRLLNGLVAQLKPFLIRGQIIVESADYEVFLV